MIKHFLTNHRKKNDSEFYDWTTIFSLFGIVLYKTTRTIAKGKWGTFWRYADSGKFTPDYIIDQTIKKMQFKKDLKEKSGT